MKRLAIDNRYKINEVRRGCEIVEEYVSKNKLILYGGEAIHYSLLAVGKEGIYEDYEIPDYDFYSTNNVIDAYEIFKLVVKEKLGSTSVLPAFHPETMRVRLFSNDYIADSTYIDKLLYKLNLDSAISYKRLLIRHPFIQYSDQFRAFSYPFEDIGELPTILYRGVKDMTRFKLLYEGYPTTDRKPFLNSIGVSKGEYKPDKSYIIDKDKTYSGIVAYSLYWLLYKSEGKPVDIENMIKTNLPNSVLGEQSKEKHIKMYGNMLAYKYKIDDIEYIVPSDKTGVQRIKTSVGKIKVVSVPFLIIHLYSEALLHYRNNSSLTYQYFDMYLHMIELTYSAWFEKKIKKFMPSINVVGEPHKSTIHRFIEENPTQRLTIKPDSFNFALGDDENKIFKTIPEKYKYPDVYDLE